MRDGSAPDLFNEALLGKLAFNLTRAGYFLATAESCTGGLIAAACTEIAGASAWFRGGVVAYADGVKEALLGVPSSLIKEHGAVSGPVVRLMALGALSRCEAQASIAVSGVAGPDGGTPDKPVGTVWIAVAVMETPGVCLFNHAELAGTFPGCTREEIAGRPVAVHAARRHFGGGRSGVRGNALRLGLLDLAALLEANSLRAS